jgi:four helix bundle protein
VEDKDKDKDANRAETTNERPPMTLTSYHDLIVWQRAIDFVVSSYKLTGQFPKNELYGLMSQLQRAAVSVPSNIADGAGRNGTREFLHHLGIARGSLFEAETQIIIAERLGYATAADTAPLAEVAQVGRLLHGLIAALERKLAQDH